MSTPSERKAILMVEQTARLERERVEEQARAAAREQEEQQLRDDTV